MRVNIDEIKEAGTDRRWDVARDDLDGMVQGDRSGWRARGGAHVDVHLQKVERRVLVRAHAVAPLSTECGRCLTAVTADVPVDFQLTMVPEDEYQEETGPAEDQAHRPVAGSFDTRTAEEEAYTGKVIDLDPIVREQVLLALPAYPVCKDDCQGLCTVCGGNLNEKACGCDRSVPDPRWAGLARFKTK